MKQYLTISLERDLLRRARIIAAGRGTCVGKMVADELARAVEDAEAYERPRRQARAMLEKGFHMGGQPLPPRDELHER